MNISNGKMGFLTLLLVEGFGVYLIFFPMNAGGVFGETVPSRVNFGVAPQDRTVHLACESIAMSCQDD